MSSPGASSEEPDSGYDRLEQQIRWYDQKSTEAQHWYKRVKLSEFVLAGVVPFSALLSGKVTAVAGVLLIVAQALQQLNQWQHNWITFRSTCEALRHEKYSFVGGSGVYDGLDAEGAQKMLVERVEALISTEHAKWQSRQEYAKKADAKQGQRQSQG